MEIETRNEYKITKEEIAEKFGIKEEIEWIIWNGEGYIRISVKPKKR